ncbi:hypothetical protein LTR53_015765 [Teratosphaeriaceae sp. CCFEE 6253]|nr:hypothetical protein LTR53_015765 [Teratosphaeriaceae sp. CCFEE 6253]
MLAPSHHTAFAPHAHSPPTPSPLSPRSANIHGRTPIPYTYPSFASMEQSDDSPLAKQHQPQPQSLYSPLAPPKKDWAKKRPVKKAPSPAHDELRDRRRGLFLKSVREAREDARWAQRGEDMMRLDFMRSQRAWEAAQAREARGLPSEPAWEEDQAMEEDDGLYDLPSLSNMAMQSSQHQHQQQLEGEDEELEAVMRQEDEEMEALLAYMPDEHQQQQHQRGQGHAQGIKVTSGGGDGIHTSGEFGSDDDDYDALFSEIVMGESGGTGLHHTIQQPETMQGLPTEDEEMDIS